MAAGVPGAPPLGVVVLISGSGSNLQALDAKGAGFEIRAVISNVSDAFGLKRAEAAGIHARVLGHHGYPSRGRL